MSKLNYPMILLAVVLSSCGGGGSGGSDPTPSNNNTGNGTNTGTDNGTDTGTGTGTDTGTDTGTGSIISTGKLAQPVADRTLSYSTSDSGEDKSIELWGLDTAWVSEGNILRGIEFMGVDQIDLVRVSFTPTSALVNGALQQAEQDLLDLRLDYVDLVSPTLDIVLNADAPSIDPSFKNADGTTNAANWAEMMAATLQHAQSRGHTVVAAAPFNEPDYSTAQGNKQDFYNIADALSNMTDFGNVRITGGNTLNDDVAWSWYDFLQDKLQEGNTHQLAGTLNNYASFFQKVTANGDRGVNDELHNVAEAMIGVEYGMQTGIWWGTAELARGEFVKASDGKRLGYAEHRPNWTAASIYRAPDGRVQAFGGASERQAFTTTYRLVSKDRDVFYNGYGPTREYTMFIPGGTGYWVNQYNAETVVNVDWGDDVQPAISGRYFLVNKNSQLVLEVADSSTDDGAVIQQGTYLGAANQLWDVTPLPPTNGGDYSYFQILAAHSGKAADVYNWSLDEGGDVRQWGYGNGGNQHWFLSYDSDGWFSICSRHSGKCLQADNGSYAEGEKIVQARNDGQPEQLWRLVPEGAELEFNAPMAPAGLMATAQSGSVRLDWDANTDNDLAGYTVLRSETSGGGYEIIARDLQENNYVDHGVEPGNTYFYQVQAADLSLNQSDKSSEVSAAAINDNSLIAQLVFDENALDSTVNENDALVSGEMLYSAGYLGNALDLNGTDQFVQLPATVANHDSLSVSTWVYWKGGDANQKILDFGNDQTQQLYLTPSDDQGSISFVIKNGADEQIIQTSVLPTNQWVHVALVVSASETSLYLNGTLLDQLTSANLTAMDIKPVANFIGRSQNPEDPLFNGLIDDFRVYNYGLSGAEVSDIYNGVN